MKTPLNPPSYLHKPHIRFVQDLWFSKLGNINGVIDATLGNGHDSLFLIDQIINKNGWLIGLDIQSQALQAADELIKNQKLESKNIDYAFFQLCHSKIDTLNLKSAPDLIVYNLGYLPKGDKNITTLKETTIESLEKAIHLLASFGMITITLYPGHDEGYHEAKLIETWVENLSMQLFSVLKLNWIKNPTAPFVIVIQKRK